MSPSEDDLRRALRDGEGSGVDVGTIMAAGERRRSQRRVRIGSGLTVAALVAVVGGGVVLVNSGGEGGRNTSADSAGGQAAADGGSAAGSAGTAQRPAAPQVSAAPSSSTARSSTARSSGPSCPARFPSLAGPDRGAGALFAKPVASVLVCGYDTGGTRRTGETTVRGATADRLVDSLETAPKSDSICPAIRIYPRPNYALLATATDGTVLRTATLSLGRPTCQNTVTNGTATRHSYDPPSGLDTILSRIAGPQAPIRITPSPIRS